MRAVLIISLLILSGCGTTLYPVCRHKAMTAAIVAGEAGYHVRIATGPTPSGGKHAQAQMYDEKWEWLRVGDRGEVYTAGMDDFTPEWYWTPNQYYESRFSEIMERMK